MVARTQFLLCPESGAGEGSLRGVPWKLSGFSQVRTPLPTGKKLEVDQGGEVCYLIYIVSNTTGGRHSSRVQMRKLSLGDIERLARGLCRDKKGWEAVGGDPRTV